MISIGFAPQWPLWLLVTLITVCAAISVYGFLARARGSWARGLAFLILIAAIANPLILNETREKLPDIAVLLIDRSQSMGVENRKPQSEAALRSLRDRIKADKTLELREVSVSTVTTGEDNGTQAFSALQSALADAPPDRIAGAIMITDGEVHDVPQAGQLGFDAPVHALIAGRRDERDRKLTIVNAARFAIVGQQAEIVLKVEDFGQEQEGAAAVQMRVDGADAGVHSVMVGQESTIRVPINHGGENVVEVEARPGPAELTLQNNRAVVTVTGVRDRLRVLLVSGEPHAGERVWRNLLKADPSVDLVHFTILRPPDKQDATPIEELSLIAFPTRELFQEKLDQFDLVIFDRYRERGILPLAYFENIARYVDTGGALLVSSGPEFAEPMSIYRTPLAGVLPAQPTGSIFAQAFRPQVTAQGLAHPVTRALSGANTESSAATWGRWFRLIGANRVSGETVLAGPAAQPLLVLDKVGKGRVAEFLSDQAWLWARGFEGGGPQAELLRRLAHWLMKEPELEEERLMASITNGDMRIERRSMAANVSPVRVTFPSGKTLDVTLTKTEAGIWKGAAVADELGLYRLSDGILSAVTAAGPLNPKEVADMRATETILKPVAEESGGSVRWLSDGLPSIRRVSKGDRASGSDWIGLKSSDAYRVTAIEQQQLLPNWLALILLLGTVLLAWRIEGR